MPELRRLFQILREPEEQREKHLWWSRFRRVHQAGAKRAHVARRAAQLPLVSPMLPPAWQVVGLAPLSDEQWEDLHALFFPPQHAPRRNEVDYRLIVEGILWIILAQHPSSLRSLVEGALLLSSMERGWAMGTHPTRFAGSGGSPLLLGLT